MEKIKLALSAQQILNTKFPYDPTGYNALIVDEFLDRIIKDYLVIEQKGLVYESDYNNLVKEVTELKDKLQELEIENGKYKARFDNIKIEDNVTSDNINLLKRINNLEKLLYKYGIDPNEKI